LFDAFVGTLADRCRAALPDNVELLLNEAAREVVIEGAVERMQEALLSICNNAWEAMPDGGTLPLSAHGPPRTDSLCETGSALIAISDTGGGIEPDVLPRIFDPFFSTKRTVGVGLSLAVTRRVVEDHGGHIDVDSAPGRGTTVRVFLPVTGTASATE